MARFLKHTILFLIPLLMVLGIYEFGLRQIPNNYKYKNALLHGDYEGIVLGNSHAYRGVIAENFYYKTINLSNVSQSIDIDYKWFEKSIEHNDIKFIIVSVSFPTLLSNLSESDEHWRIKFYNIYTDLRLDYKINHNFEFLNNLQKNNITNLYNYICQPNNYKVTCLNKGSYPLDITLNNFQESALKASNRHLNQGLRLFKNNFKILDSLTSKALDKNIKVLILIPPMHKNYRDLIANNYSEKLFSAVQLIVKGKNIYFLNYYNDSEFENSMFKDSDHLNFKGAELLTQKINTRLIEIL